MTFAVFAEDDAPNGGDPRAIEQYVSRLTAVCADAGNIGKRVEGAGGFFANETQLIESCQK